jgi:hypothetical protein
MRRSRYFLFVLLGLCELFFLFLSADGFHGAMNSEELDEIWEQVKYDLLTQSDPSSQAKITKMASEMLLHLRYLNSYNVIPREFPNFRASGVPQAKATAMRVLKELGEPGLKQVIQELINQLKYNQNREPTFTERFQGELTQNEDYLENLKKIVIGMGEDALIYLESIKARQTPQIRAELEKIITAIRSQKKDFISRTEINEQEIQKAIQLAVEFLKKIQKADGSWDYLVFSKRDFTSGTSALVLYALLKAGVSPQSAVIENGRKRLMQRVDSTYSVALMSLFLSQLDKVRYKEALSAYAKWLEERQLSNGLWGYGYQGDVDTHGDFSNTQFALLGLRACEQAGVFVSPEVWTKARGIYLSAQNRDGGFGYRFNQVRNSYGSMSAAAVVSLVLAGEDFKEPVARQKLYQSSGNYVPTREDCGKYLQNPVIRDALQWIEKHFSMQHNPGTSGIYPFHYYYLFCIEQLGRTLNVSTIGDRDWYLEGAHYLLKNQRTDGSWHTAVDTAFALIFLSKEPQIPLVHHLQWQKQGTIHENDVKNLLFFARSHLGGSPSHQVLAIEKPVEEFLKAPILFLNGHDPLNFSEEERGKLRRFLESGGLLYAEACCSSKEFDLSFRREMSFIYPERRLQTLPSEHLVYRLAFPIPKKSQFLEGYPGCQTRVVYSPIEQSCRWDENYSRHHIAFKLGTNVLLYGLGTDPKRDLLLKSLLPFQEDEQNLRRGALVVAQIKHQGDWNTDPLAISRLMLHLKTEANIRVSLQRKELYLSDPDLYEYPILYLTGHDPFTLNETEVKQLRDFLEKGGFLFADACCGRKAFDQAFRVAMQQVFPQRPLTPVPEVHPVFHLGRSIKQVQFKSFLAETRGDAFPRLEMIEIQSRACVIYSAEDLGCALEDHLCVECLGLKRESALNLATNIILYGLNY